MNLIGIAREPRWPEEGLRNPAAEEEFASLYTGLYPPALQLIRAILPGTLFKWGLRDCEPLPQYCKGRLAMPPVL
jgi:salicylate hydroxylase